ncbi:peroxisome assembly protein 12 [Skeletonema marinoi]|uniref:Peroxin-12 n=1 Tax=Skeletonema marinoi TaxID=267567 RepID=A0AAD8Y6U5_9STRA|nr:peroxisome assembly protein 12 [Skeletonema marinoi]
MNATGGTTANNPSTQQQHNPTVPTTIGALLTEEYTLDPLSHQPSFLELTCVDVARNSGRVALSAMWEVGVTWLEGVLGRLRRMEHLADRLLAYSTAAARSPSSTNMLAAFSKTIKTTTCRIKLWYYSHLRRMCHLLHRTIKTFGPELQILILFAIDYNCIHYLSGSTACEMVYGLKRSKLVQSSSSKGQYKVVELTKWDKTMSALLAALFPYCKQRCDNWYKELTEQSESEEQLTAHFETRMQISQGHDTNRQLQSNNINSTNYSMTLDKFKQKIVNFYPYLHMTHELSIFLYQFAYLLEYTPYWSFSMHTLRVMLRRMTVADVQEQQRQKQPLLQKSQKDGERVLDANIMTKKNDAPPINPSSMIKGALLFSVSYVLLSGWVSHFQRELRLRRRRWIAGEGSSTANDTTTDDNNAGTSRKQLPIPPPPMNLEVLVDDEGNTRHIDKWSCPICHEPRINPTASTSGYVFCYRCLIMHLRQKGEHCPVTGVFCNESMVIRLFEPTATSKSANRRPNTR